MLLYKYNLSRNLEDHKKVLTEITLVELEGNASVGPKVNPFAGTASLTAATTEIMQTDTGSKIMLTPFLKMERTNGRIIS